MPITLTCGIADNGRNEASLRIAELVYEDRYALAFVTKLLKLMGKSASNVLDQAELFLLADSCRLL